jgi:(1->4)-alpha-D-glucan 1-alpha-D-glucosylmutase
MVKVRPEVRIPVATYRLQFNQDFRLDDARRIVDYLHELGVTDLYASPLLKARPGSAHGYDVTDPSVINPEVGDSDALNRLSNVLQSHNMGLMLDIVPNHMAASLDNPWWFDVLEKGESSPYAAFFDVNWDMKKVLLPILRRPYGETLENHELVLRMENGRPVVQYYEQRLPVAAGAENLRPEAIDQVLSKQHYRLAFWRKAADSINYRRFFDVSDLVGLRADRDDVFHATHAYPLELFDQGRITALRIDHVDGLLDPKGYLDRLPQTYVVVEKILGADENVPEDWHTSGTTGYDFLNYLNGAFVDPEGYRQLTEIYAKWTGLTKSRAKIFRERKRQVMAELFTGEVNALMRRLFELAQEDRYARDLATADLREAFIKVTACLPVYRTYIRGLQIEPRDREYIDAAIAAAGRGTAYDFLRRVLLLDPAWYLQNRKTDYLNFVMHWQQFTGPVMAKGLEDTTFYVHNPLVSLNEVGSDSNGPETFFGVDEFHRRNLARRRRFPHTMNATSTHDTKRSEDVRARINVLSEVPAEWLRYLRRWSRWNRSQTAPDANEQILIYQTMLGAWPIDAERLKSYVTKALREGRTHTSWIDVNLEYERRVLAFVDLLYSKPAFLTDLSRFERKIAWFGALSSLSQVVLKITSPGVPDFYRGTEMWDLSLADPDNRRPVDFSVRVAALEELKLLSDPGDLLQNWSDGRIKMFLTWKALNFRRDHSELFLDGEYVPLTVKGARANHIIAFARRLKNQWSITVVSRLLAKLGRPMPLGKRAWGNTTIELPEAAPQAWLNVFTGDRLSTPLLASRVFMTLPVAVLEEPPLIP